jgi:alkaline phosphatase
MLRSFKKLLPVLATLTLLACSTAKPTTTSVSTTDLPKPKNVILLIGDGMGLPQITGAMYMNNNKIVFEEFTNIGFHKSDASDNLVTDSAAGATAFACGAKTYNGAIGVNAKKNPVPSILEMAEDKGMATGIVVSCSVTHATPGSFIAHVESRELVEDIALGYLETPIDLVIGGGLDHFTRRRDERDLVAELKNKGYAVSDFFNTNIQDLNVRTDKNIAYFTANGEPLPVRQGRDYMVPATYKALDFLRDRSPEGFFLMIEGAQIDWGGHAKDADYVVTELLEFDKVIRAALDFARKDGNTLVVVTGDHETGGFAVQPGSKLNNIEVSFTTKSHTAIMIPVFADGPGAGLFRGVYDNTEIFQKLKALMRLP